MKSIIKKMLKTLLIMIITTLIIYLVFTITAFSSWCSENQISIFLNSNELLLNLDSSKIQELGDTIGNIEHLMEDSLNETYESDNQSLAKYYDPLGYAVWIYMQTGISEVLNKYLNMSILLGISLALAYIIITTKKINNIVKFILGYFLPILIVPQILFLSYFYRFVGIFKAYYNTPYIQYFYIIYTAIFILMYVINYKVGKKMAKKLNQVIIDK